MRVTPDEMLEAANEILRETRKIFILGSSNIRPIKKKFAFDDNISMVESLFLMNDHQSSVNAIIIDSLRTLAKNSIFSNRVIFFILKSIIHPEKYSKIRIQLRILLLLLAIKNRAGNCGEMCLYALIYFLKNKKKFREMNIEFFSFSFDHSFIALRRESEPFVERLEELNSDTIILDLWLWRIFSVDEFKIFWIKNFSSIIPKSNDDKINPSLGLELKIKYSVLPEEYKDFEKTNIDLTRGYSLDMAGELGNLLKTIEMDSDIKESNEKLNLEDQGDPINFLRLQTVGSFRRSVIAIIDNKELNFFQKQKEIKTFFQIFQRISLDLFYFQNEHLVLIIKDLRKIYNSTLLELLKKGEIKPKVEVFRSLLPEERKKKSPKKRIPFARVASEIPKPFLTEKLKPNVALGVSNPHISI